MGMIRGVNKHIIEITDTGNESFERAILFLRPNSVNRDAQHLKSRAGEYLLSLRLRPWLCDRGRMWRTVLKFGIGAAVGAAVTAWIFFANFVW